MPALNGTESAAWAFIGACVFAAAIAYAMAWGWL